MDYARYIKPNTDGTFAVTCNTQDCIEDIGVYPSYAEAVKAWDEAMLAYNHVPIPNRGTNDNTDRDDEYGLMGGAGLSDSEMDWVCGRMEAWEKDLWNHPPVSASRAKAMGGARVYVHQMRGVIRQYRKKYPNDHI